jgi:hypothetical protein
VISKNSAGRLRAAMKELIEMPGSTLTIRLP